MTRQSPPSTEGRDNERSYRLSEEALEVLAVAKSKHRLSEFVSQCIVAHGKIILGEDAPTTEGTIEDRLNYLEEAVVAWAYNELVDEDEGWDAATIKAHQDVLKSTGKKQWNNTSSIKKILAAARKKPKTADTGQHEWQTLLRCREDFMALKK